MIEQSQESSLEDLKATYNNLAFIHQKFLTTPFYLEEAKQADASIRFITELANQVAQKIDSLTPKEEVKAEGASNE